MDNITHSLVGLMLARAGLEKTTPRGTAMMVLAANAPDIDAVFWFSGTQTYHRMASQLPARHRFRAAGGAAADAAGARPIFLARPFWRR